jgi:hypothetical protein
VLSSRRVKKGPGRRPQSAKRRRFMELRARGWSILAAAREVGVSRTTGNVCFFRVEGQAPKRRLVPENHHGRGKKSSCTVYEGDGGRGTEAFRALDARQSRSWREGNGEEEPAGWNRDKAYRSFMAVYVATESALFGMITMDAVDPEAFHPKVDLPTVQTVADLYAAILAGLSAPKDHPDQSGATFER